VAQVTSQEEDDQDTEQDTVPGILWSVPDTLNPQAPRPAVRPNVPPPAAGIGLDGPPPTPAGEAIADFLPKNVVNPVGAKPVGAPAVAAPDTLSPTQQGMGSSLDNTLAALLPRMGAARQQQAQVTRQEALGEEKQLGEYRQKIAQAYADHAPREVDFGNKPQQPQVDPLEQFGSLASMVGIFASAFTRKPILTALKASTAAMNAERAGDLAAYDRSYKEWQDGIEMGLKRNKQDLEKLSQILELAGTDQSAAMAQLKAHAAADGSNAAAAIAEIGDTVELGKLQASLQRAQNQMEANKISLNNQFIKNRDAMAKEQLGQMAFDEAKKSGASDVQASIAAVQAKAGKEPFVALTDKTLDFAARTYLQTGVIPNLGYGSSPDRKKILERASELSSGAGQTPEDVVATQAGTRADKMSLGNLQKQADMITSFENTVLDNMSVAGGLKDKGAGTPIGPVINRWIQGGRIATGDPDVKAFNAAMETVAGEYAKIMSGSTGAAAATEGATQRAKELISTIDSPQAIDAVFGVMQKDMHNRTSNLSKQRDTIKGRMSTKKGAVAPASADDQLEDPLGIR
jgi:hypothetical protein